MQVPDRHRPMLRTQKKRSNRLDRIATIGYGCCGAPQDVTFISDSGKEVGFLETFKAPSDHLDQVFNLRNVSNGMEFLGTSNENSKNTYSFFHKGKDGKMLEEPAQVEFQSPGECIAWTFERLEYFNKTPKLYFRSYECDPYAVWSGTCKKKGHLDLLFATLMASLTIAG